MLKKKWFTWVLIAGIGLLPVPAAMTYLHTYIIRNAVVTAYCYEVRAPIDGIVKHLAAGPGSTPKDGPVLTLENFRTPLSDVAGLQAEYREHRKYHQTLEDELASLNARLAQNQALAAEYIDTIQKDLEQSLGILAEREKGEAARLEEARMSRKRILSLVDTAVASQEDADAVEAEFQEAKAKVAATGLEISQVRSRLKVLQRGLFPPDLSDGVLQVQNRINTLYLDIINCKRRIHASTADVSKAEEKLKALKADLETKTTRAVVTLGESAVIWDVDVREEMEVAKGDKLFSYIDRSRLMVEVAVDDSTLELIREGHPVRIRLFGSSRFITGSVIQVMGSAGNWPEHRYAAAVKLRSPRDGRVLVAIDDQGLQRDVKRLCGVGRTAYAEFDGIGLIEHYFGTFLR